MKQDPKLRQIQIDQRLIAGLQMLRCLSDRSVSAPTRTEAMAAVMETLVRKIWGATGKLTVPPAVAIPRVPSGLATCDEKCLFKRAQCRTHDCAPYYRSKSRSMEWPDRPLRRRLHFIHACDSGAHRKSRGKAFVNAASTTICGIRFMRGEDWTNFDVAMDVVRIAMQ